MDVIKEKKNEIDYIIFISYQAFTSLTLVYPSFATSED